MRSGLIFTILSFSIQAFGQFAIAHSGVLESPENCLAAQKMEICAVRSSEPAVVSFSGVRWILGAGTSVLIKDSQVYLVDGRAIVITEHAERIQLPHAQLTFKGELFFQRNLKREFIAHNLRGELSIASGKAKLEIPEGFEITFKGINQIGELVYGTPVVPHTEKLSERIAKFPVLPKANQRQIAYEGLRRRAFEAQSSLFKNIVEQRVAASEQRDELFERKKRQVQLENQKLKRLFREKNNFEDL